MIPKLISEFILDRESRNRSATTIKYYKLELKYFNQYLSEQNITTIEQITPTVLRMWFGELGTHRQQGGIAGSFRTIKSFLIWVWNEYDYQTKNPIYKVNVSPAKNQPLPEIPIDAVKQLLTACVGYNSLRNQAILHFMVDTGVRASELTALNIEDIGEDGSVMIRHGKGNKFRIGWMGKSSTKALRTYLKTRPDVLPTDALFISNRNKRVTFYGLREIIFGLCKRANITFYTPHSFRRLFALTLYRQTHDILLVQRLLGHINLIVTTRYLNIGNSDLKEQHNMHSPADLL